MRRTRSRSTNQLTAGDDRLRGHRQRQRLRRQRVRQRGQRDRCVAPDQQHRGHERQQHAGRRHSRRHAHAPATGPDEDRRRHRGPRRREPCGSRRRVRDVVQRPRQVRGRTGDRRRTTAPPARLDATALLRGLRGSLRDALVGRAWIGHATHGSPRSASGSRAPGELTLDRERAHGGARCESGGRSGALRGRVVPAPSASINSLIDDYTDAGGFVPGRPHAADRRDRAPRPPDGRHVRRASPSGGPRCSRNSSRPTRR